MFAFRNCKIEIVPPTLHALEQHVKRAVYQVGHNWGQLLSGEPQAPSPDLWVWKKVSDDSQWGSQSQVHTVVLLFWTM